eukprot:s1629_g3.t1
MPLGKLERVKKLAKSCGLEEFVQPQFVELGHEGNGTGRQKDAVKNLGQVAQHALRRPFVLDRTASEAEKELSGRFLTYSGEEAELSENTTASDASSTGGAVGRSIKLRTEGEEFACMDRQGLSQGKPIPVMVLSLFNGIGCAYRCYDLCGFSPAVCIAYELSPEANRVAARRWSALQIFGDVKTLSIEDMRSWRYKYPEVIEIQLWAGFPCTDLCSAKWERQNLEGDASGLFWEIVRILTQIKEVFGFDFVVRYAIENVVSMDRDAEQEISRTLGVRPLRMDPADAVPTHRPRFFWSNVGLEPMDHVWIEEKPYWLEVHMEHSYPLVEQWLEEGAYWPGGRMAQSSPQR